MNYHETRTEKIRNKVFSVPFFKQYFELFTKKFVSKGDYITIEINTSDGSSFSATSSDIFDEPSVTSKILSSIRISAKNTDYSSSASVYVAAGNYGDSRFEVKSSETSRVNDLFQQMKDILNTVPNQFSIFRKYPLMFLFTIFLSFASLFDIAARTIKPDIYVSDRFSPSVSHAIFFAFMLLFAFIPAGIVNSVLDTIWPSIEILPTNSNRNTLGRLRSVMKGILVMLVAPIMINIISAFLE